MERCPRSMCFTADFSGAVEKICPVCSEFDQYSMIKSRKVVEISLVKIYNERQRHEEKMYKMKADLK